MTAEGRHASFFDVGLDTLYAEFPGKGADDYGLRIKKGEASKAGPQSSVRTRADQLRAEAGVLLDQLIGEATDTGAVRQSPRRLGFYSQLERAVEQVPARLETQPAAQWKAWLNSNAAKLGVKKDEIQWSGLPEWLELRGKARVEKDEILSYLEQGGVRVEEVVLGGERFDTNNPQLRPGMRIESVPEEDRLYRRYSLRVVDARGNQIGLGSTGEEAIR